MLNSTAAPYKTNLTVAGDVRRQTVGEPSLRLERTKVLGAAPVVIFPQGTLNSLTDFASC